MCKKKLIKNPINIAYMFHIAISCIFPSLIIFTTHHLGHGAFDFISNIYGMSVIFTFVLTILLNNRFIFSLSIFPLFIILCELTNNPLNKSFYVLYIALTFSFLYIYIKKPAAYQKMITSSGD